MNPWSSPLDPRLFASFRRKMRTPQRLGASAVVNERTLKYSFMLAVDDVGDLTQPKLLNVIELANAKETAAGPVDDTTVNGYPGFNTTSPQEPKIDAKGTIPVGTTVLIGGIGVIVFVPLVWARSYEATPTSNIWAAPAAAEDAYAGIQAAFDASMLQVNDARNEKIVLSGHELTSYGAGRGATVGPPATVVDGAAAEVLWSGQLGYKDRGWARISPIEFDGGANGRAASQIVLNMQVPRATDWPLRPDTRMRVDVIMRSLIAYQGSAGNVECDPAAGTPMPYPTPANPPMGERIQPDLEW